MKTLTTITNSPFVPSVKTLVGAALLFTAVTVWWIGGYIGTISYHEQLQMFLTDGGYFCERLSLPGGLADYLSELLVSFFFFAQIGAGIIAALVVLVQLLMWALIRRHSDTAVGYALSLVPAMMVWAVLGNPDILMSLPVAMIGVLALCCVAKPRWWLVAVLLPVTYWLFGTMFYGMAIYLALYALAERRWVTMGVTVVLTIAIMVVSTYWLNYPLYRILVGLHYYRYPTTLPYVLVVPMLFASVMPFVAKAAGRVKVLAAKNDWKVLLPALVVCVVPCYLLVRSMYVKEVHDVLEYDYLVRSAQWDKVIAKADKQSPNTPNTVVCLNLALQQSGLLPYTQFRYFQNGPEGLLQDYNKDFLSPLPTAEAMFRLGMINAAQQYFFEAQEAIPDYRKSARLTRRLAETNLINSQYEVARKYLGMLKKTLFYASWVKEVEPLVGNEKAIDAHKLYGQLRKNQYADDFLFSNKEMDMMLGLLLVKNPKNKMAYEYLMSYIILNRDLQHFYDYFQLGKDLGYEQPPSIYQDVHALLEAQKSPNGYMGQQYQSSGTWNYILGTAQ